MTTIKKTTIVVNTKAGSTIVEVSKNEETRPLSSVDAVAIV